MTISVLIVDDSSLVRRLIRNILETNHIIEIIGEVQNGQEALIFLQSHQPDVILLDIEMPVMDGLTFLRYARLRSKSKIIILSSVGTLGSEQSLQAYKMGADAVISKPSGVISLDLQEKRASTLMNVINHHFSLS